MERIRALLKEAVAQDVITRAQAEQLRELAAAQDADTAAQTRTLRLTHLLYYVGGCIAIGAMSVFMTLGWDAFGAVGLLSIATAYAVGSAVLTEGLYRNGYRIPAGLTATLTTVLVPLAVYGAQLAAGWWPAETEHRPFFAGFDRRALMLQATAIATAGAALVRYRLPFLTLPLAVLAWYAGMSTAAVVLAWGPGATALPLWTSAVLGVAIIGAGTAIRRTVREAFATWPYMVGGLLLWGSLSLLTIQGELWPGVYAALNSAALVLGVVVERRVAVITGAVGLTGYLTYLAYDVFADSVWFPFALTCLGLAIVAIGIGWQRHGDAWRRRLRIWTTP